MSKNALARSIRLSMLLAAVCCAAPATFAQDEAALKSAIQCKDFKHNRDGSWYAESVTLNYGPQGQKQMNLFGATIKKGKADPGEPDLWAVLNEKCGAVR